MGVRVHVLLQGFPVFISALLAIVLLSGRLAAQPAEIGAPLLTGVNAPRSFELNRYQSLIMHVGVEAQNVDPSSDGEIVVFVTDLKGNIIEVPVFNTLRPSAFLHGKTDVAIAIGHAATWIGERRAVMVCARSETIPGTPCAVVELYSRGNPLDTPTKDNAELIAVLKKKFPGIGCRCKSGAIRLAPADTNHGTLGAFTDVVGGAQYGPFHKTDAAAGTLTSVYKFEPHFEIEILNAPAKPDGLDAAAWSDVEKAFPVLCSEGQRINSTLTLARGKTDEKKIDEEAKDAAGATKKYPYELTEDPDKMTWDGHGYRAPSDSGSATIKGALKAWDRNIIHWLDAPGIAAADKKVMARAAPSSQSSNFHAFVHGTTGKDEDNCDCYFAMETGIVDANADAAASVLLKNPECK